MTDLSDFGCCMARVEDGVLRSADATLQEWLGRDPLGRPWTELLTKASAVYWDTVATPMMARTGGVRDVAVDLRTETGSFPVLVFATQEQGVSMLMVPFVARRSFHAAMAQAADDARRREAEIRHLQALEEMRTGFINSIAHELATPMTPIKLQASILAHVARASGDDRQVAAIRTLQANIDRLDHFHDSLVEAAKMQARAVGTDLRSARLDELVEASVQTWRLGHDAEVDVRTEPCQAMMDPDAARACLFHVLDNAVRFGPRDGPVHVSVHGGARPTIRIRDEGPGMPASKDAEQVFAMEGAGLGLEMVTGLMRSQGGSMRIDSGKGTEVVLAFQGTEAA